MATQRCPGKFAPRLFPISSQTCSARRSVRQAPPYAANGLAYWGAVLSLGLLASGGVAAEDSDDVQVLQPVTVNAKAGGVAPTEGSGSYTTRASNTASRLDMSLRETPQSVSVITRTQLQDFALTDINDVLAYSPGVTVEQVETDRTYFTARGFDITNFQLDGIGVPFVYGNLYGDIDTAIYDRIEVLRGANGLMTGTGTPSATVNFVRKRPTADTQASVGISYGSWDNRRVDADVSGALLDSERVRGRLVVSYQDKESYLDRYEQEKTIFYGVVEADLNDSTTLTLGHSRQDTLSNSPMWGALPLYRTDGSATNYDASVSTATDWAYWDGRIDSSFAELAHDFANGWRVKGVLTRQQVKADTKLFYVYGTPNPDTSGSDLYAYPSLYGFDNEQWIADVYATGPFTLGGREHEAVIGLNWSKSKVWDESKYGAGIGTEIDDIDDWDGNYPDPEYNAGVAGSEFTDKRRSLYAATRLKPMDRLTLITGFRVTDLESSGVTYGDSKKETQSGEVVPYAGVVADIHENHSVYVSYTKIFDPQFKDDIDHNRIAPVKGDNIEAGLKSGLFNERLNTTVAVFKTEQDNVAEVAGVYPGTSTNYYKGVDGVSSQGYELEIAGEVSPGWEVAGGFTYVSIEDKDGEDAKTYVPRRMLRLSSSYRVPSLERLKVGASLSWQDDIYREQGVATTGPNAGESIRTTQEDYMLVNLMAKYDFTDNWSATLNLDNITDEKYLNSLYWAQSYYGAPRSAKLTVNWTY
ncbi:TonB-dependent siderophore receptor [Hahella sp. CR1]|uniref:TonB-dependent siderophore receptor n=1 Tax=Hahella sp. CR1 TaxID=2992807 RepID=UPI0024421F92|nr:TonB-dependent siderophore receptor [Hahella sp. CR1]MDG9671437.1 TonB-dependent siderophore receptor [Hahella sp. CR1]